MSYRVTVVWNDGVGPIDFAFPTLDEAETYAASLLRGYDGDGVDTLVPVRTIRIDRDA